MPQTEHPHRSPLRIRSRTWPPAPPPGIRPATDRPWYIRHSPSRACRG